MDCQQDGESPTTTNQATSQTSDERSRGDIPRHVWMNVKLDERPYQDPLRALQPSSAAIHAGYRSNGSERSIKPPIYRSSAFQFSSAEEGEVFFKRAYNLEGNDGKSPGLVYSRFNNPNTEIFEEKFVSLEKGSMFASAFPSGMSAISTTVMALVPRGGHIIYSNPVSGASYIFLETICPARFGIYSQSADTSNKEALREAIEEVPRLDMLYIESPANPTLAITDIAFATSLAKLKNGECLVFVNNTLMGPVFQSPFLHGADVVLYSASAFVGGHSDLMGGVALTNSEDLIYKINGFRTILGPVISPDSTWMLTRSIETLWMRMQRQAEKAQKVAAALAGHRHVQKILFPGNYSSETNNVDRDEKSELWGRQCTGTGSMISIVVRPNTRRAAFKVLNALGIPHLGVSLGSTETLVEHPRSMTHSGMRTEDLDACGIVEGMIRISVGLESSKDLIKDFLSALDTLRDEFEVLSVHSA